MNKRIHEYEQTKLEYSKFIQTIEDKPRPFNQRDSDFEIVSKEYPLYPKMIDYDIEDLRIGGERLLKKLNKINRELMDKSHVEEIEKQYQDKRRKTRNNLIMRYNEINELIDVRVQEYWKYFLYAQNINRRPLPLNQEDSEVEAALEKTPQIIELMEKCIDRLKEENERVIMSINEINLEFEYEFDDIGLDPEPNPCCNEIWCECNKEVDDVDWDEYEKFWQKYCDELTKDTEKYYK